MPGDEQAPRTVNQLVVVFGITRQRPSERRHQLTILTDTLDFYATTGLVHVLLESIMQRPHAAAKRIDSNDSVHGQGSILDNVSLRDFQSRECVRLRTYNTLRTCY